MAKKIDRSVRIVRALADVQAQVQIEGWERDDARLARLAGAVNDALLAAHEYANAKAGLPMGYRVKCYDACGITYETSREPEICGACGSGNIRVEAR